VALRTAAKYSNQRARDREPIFFPREPYWVPSPERTGHLARGLETDWNTALTAATAAETDLVRRLAVHHPDAIIAGILNRQGRCTPEDCPTPPVGSKDLRHYWKINFHQSDDQPHEGPVLTITDAATELGITASTLHR
jgi:hypothetical protein